MKYDKTMQNIERLINSDIPKEQKKKLKEFKNFLIKHKVASEDIHINDWGNMEVVAIKEGKLTYEKNPEIRLVQFVNFGRETIIQ